MKTRVQGSGLAPAQVVEDLRTVVIYDDFDNPILFVQKLETGQIISYKAGDPKFVEALKILGIGLNATVETLNVRG